MKIKRLMGEGRSLKLDRLSDDLDYIRLYLKNDRFLISTFKMATGTMRVMIKSRQPGHYKVSAQFSECMHTAFGSQHIPLSYPTAQVSLTFYPVGDYFTVI